MASGVRAGSVSRLVFRRISAHVFDRRDRNPGRRHRSAVVADEARFPGVAAKAGGNRVSIFLNIFDVHVNRTPIAGKVSSIQYEKGQFLVASKEQASYSNEQNTITVDGLAGGRSTRVVFKQIAGLIARRIVCYKKPGDTLKPGERIGLIKFGSRVDVFLG